MEVIVLPDILYAIFRWLNNGTGQSFSWSNKGMMTSLCSSVALLSEEVIRVKLSLMCIMYLDISLLNWDKVDFLIFPLIVSMKATLLWCILLQIDHKMTAPSRQYSYEVQSVIVRQKSSVGEPSSSPAKTLALYVGWSRENWLVFKESKRFPPKLVLFKDNWFINLGKESQKIIGVVVDSNKSYWVPTFIFLAYV